MNRGIKFGPRPGTALPRGRRIQDSSANSHPRRRTSKGGEFDAGLSANRLAPNFLFSGLFARLLHYVRTPRAVLPWAVSASLQSCLDCGCQLQSRRRSESPCMSRWISGSSLANQVYRKEYFPGLHFFAGISVPGFRTLPLLPRSWSPPIPAHINAQEAGMALFAGCLTFQKTFILHLVLGTSLQVCEV